MAAKKEVKSEASAKKTCFVIMPFSDPEGYEKGHFRSIYEYTFAPAIRAAGYEPLRIDDDSVSNLIHGKMMDQLVTAPMVLCDLSTNNPNVLYELGIRHAFDKPVVLVQEIGQKRIFDIGGITSVEYHPSRIYEEVLEDQRKITDAIVQTAGAKTKYSIMSLFAIHAAKPLTGESVTHEDKLEYMIRDLSRQVNSLDKRITDTQNNRKNNDYFEMLSSKREYNNTLLKKSIDEAEDLINSCEILEIMPKIEEVDRCGEQLYRRLRNCRADGDVDPVYADRAKMLLDRLRGLIKMLGDKDRNEESFASA